MTVTTNQNVEFRTDINGLRALAVLGVIAYHFNLPGRQAALSASTSISSSQAS